MQAHQEPPELFLIVIASVMCFHNTTTIHTENVLDTSSVVCSFNPLNTVWSTAEAFTEKIMYAHVKNDQSWQKINYPTPACEQQNFKIHQPESE